LSIVHSYYEIQDDCWLCLSYKSMKRTKMSETILTIDDNEDDLIARQIKDETGALRALTMDDLELSVYIKKGDEVEEDCLCDSMFMLTTMDEVGRAICSYFSWVPATTVIYLIMIMQVDTVQIMQLNNTMNNNFKCTKCNCCIKILTHLKRICSTSA